MSTNISWQHPACTDYHNPQQHSKLKISNLMDAGGSIQRIIGKIFPDEVQAGHIV
jgi:hypothetical protein